MPVGPAQLLKCACLSLIPLMLLLSPGCGGDSDSSSDDTTVSNIVVSPSTASIALNGTHTFTATAFNSAGDTLSDVTFSWNSSATNVATIDTSGVATGRGTGSTQITASGEGVTSAAATLTVNPSISSVSITPLSATIKVGQTQQFNATALDFNGNALTGVMISWNNSSATVANISSSGLATGLSPGTVVITASAASVSSQAATLTVTAE